MTPTPFGNQETWWLPWKLPLLASCRPRRYCALVARPSSRHPWTAQLKCRRRRPRRMAMRKPTPRADWLSSRASQVSAHSVLQRPRTSRTKAKAAAARMDYAPWPHQHCTVRKLKRSCENGTNTTVGISVTGQARSWARCWSYAAWQLRVTRSSRYPDVSNPLVSPGRSVQVGVQAAICGLGISHQK